MVPALTLTSANLFSGYHCASRHARDAYETKPEFNFREFRVSPQAKKGYPLYFRYRDDGRLHSTFQFDSILVFRVHLSITLTGELVRSESAVDYSRVLPAEILPSYLNPSSESRKRHLDLSREIRHSDAASYARNVNAAPSITFDRSENVI